jgi:hypothetical protein
MKRSLIIEAAIAIALLPLISCGGSSSNGGKIQFTASGEVLALGGYGFPPASGAVAFVDGWEIRFTKFLTTIDKIKLYTNPDSSPTDQSQVGSLVAEVDGPWAIDLHKGGPLVGKGGTDEKAYPIAVLDNQNKNGANSFDPATRYAFGFDLIPATASATFLQLQSNDPDYQDMITNGYVVLYVGTATWLGNGTGGAACTSPPGSSFDFTTLPQVVNFKLGFKTPTTYLNCQNPDNDPALGIGGEDHQRGIQVQANNTVVAQVTVHTDHPFWESFVHDSPAHFDQLAALATKDASGNYNVTMQATLGVDYTHFKFGSADLAWRSCVPTGGQGQYNFPNQNPYMGFVSGNIPHNPSGDPTTSIRDYNDYMYYNQSTQGHLNSDGLCFVQRHYPSHP